MRIKINDLEKLIHNYHSNSDYIQHNKSTPNRSKYNTNYYCEYKLDSQRQENSEIKYQYDYGEKSQKSEIEILQSENKILKEKIKFQENFVIKLENQISEIRALNKTCHDLLGQLNI